jgi:uncharacterized membrane protein
MAERTARRAVVGAPPERCFAVVTDFEGYPAWAPDVKEVEVLERDRDGRGTRVAYRAAAFGRSASYTLSYDYSGAPARVSWEQSEGDVTRRIGGSYAFEATADGETEVTYTLEVDLRVRVPGFIRRRAESRIVRAALAGLKARVEATR